MKKIILSTVLGLSSALLFANPNPPQSAASPAIAQQVDPQFAQVEAFLKANDYAAAYTRLSEMAKQNNPQAIYNLGYLTLHGQGTAKDEKKAIQLFQQASNLGYGAASYVLSQYYSSGAFGLKADMNKAKDYLSKASKQNYDDATAQLAFVLFSESKPDSDKKALELLEPLIKKGHLQAIFNMSLYQMSHGQINNKPAMVQQGFNGLNDLALKGYVPALMATANMFLSGDIIAQDLDKAATIFSELAKHNVPQAQTQLAKVRQLQAQSRNRTTAAKPASK